MANFPWEIEWSDALCMSNPEIDSEHQHFIELVNDLNGEIMNQRRDKAVIVNIMKLILEGAIAHFEHEERLLVENAYSAAQEHTQVHSGLTSKIKQASTERYSEYRAQHSVD